MSPISLIASSVLVLSILGIAALIWWRWREMRTERAHPIRRYIHAIDRRVVRGIRVIGRGSIRTGRVASAVAFDLLPVLLFEYGVYLKDGSKMQSKRLFKRLRRNRDEDGGVERTASAYLQAVLSHKRAVADEQKHKEGDR